MNNLLWQLPFNNEQSLPTHMGNVWNGSRLAEIYNGLIPSQIICSIFSRNTFDIHYVGAPFSIWFFFSCIQDKYTVISLLLFTFSSSVQLLLHNHKDEPFTSHRCKPVLLCQCTPFFLCGDTYPFHRIFPGFCIWEILVSLYRRHPSFTARSEGRILQEYLTNLQGVLQPGSQRPERTISEPFSQLQFTSEIYAWKVLFIQFFEWI